MSMNRAQYRAMKQAQKRNERKTKRATKRALPRCPVCSNEISEADRVPCEGGYVLHRACVERVAEARKVQAAQRMSDAGIWLPGQQ
jgi:hypothetical protein